MDSCKRVIKVYPFSYNKIIGGERKIDIRPYTRALHSLRVGDIIEYVNLETQNSVLREVKGIALFANFETMIDMLPPEMIGYSNREEIKLRIERMYSRREQVEFGVCALFIGEPNVLRMPYINRFERSA